MRNNFFLYFVLVFAFYSCQVSNNITTNTTEKNQIFQLQLIKNGVKQFDLEDNIQFDLSGITFFGDSIFVVADKTWNKFIYKIDTLEKKIVVVSEKKICVDEPTDFEGITANKYGFFLINERSSQVYYIEKSNCFIEILPINWKGENIETSDWKNKGLEGIALDSSQNILYLLKEREPRHVYAFDLKTNQLSSPFVGFYNPNQHDFTDAKFENNKLYLLERNKSQILRINLKTNELDSVSMKNILNPEGKRLYETENLEYGTVESLLLTKDQIWVGIDNNGEKTSTYGQSLGLDKTSNPAILIFKRPKNF